MGCKTFILALLTLGVAVLAWALYDVAERLLRIPSVSVPLSEKSPSAIRIGLLGTNRISSFAVGWPAAKSKDVIVQAVASRSLDKANTFSQRHEIPDVYNDYNQLITSSDIDAVYIGLPTRLHYQWAVRCIKAGKHVLVEKPIALNANETLALIDLAASAEVVLLEGYHYRYHPATANFIDLSQQQPVDEIAVDFSLFDIKSWWQTHIQTVWMYSDSDEEHKRVKLLDRWCYCVDMLVNIIGRSSDLTNSLQIVSAELSSKSFSASLVLEEEPHTKILLRAEKEVIEVPKWDATVRIPQGQVALRNFGFPFVWHQLEKPNGVVENFYNNGETTFEFQLKKFASLIKDPDRAQEVSHLLNHSLVTMRIVDEIFVAAGYPRLASM